MISEPRLVGSPKILSESLLVEPPKILSEPPWSPFAMEQIEGHLSALRSLVKEHNTRGKEIVDADLKRPFKEAVKTPLTWRIIEFAGFEFKMPSNINIDGWVELRQQFKTRFLTRRACFKDPTEITKIVRKENETIVAFKERWIVETGFITGVLKVMKISSFIDAHKSEEAFTSTGLPKGEASEAFKKSTGPINRREYRFYRAGYRVNRRRNEGRNAFNSRDVLSQL
ncbi:hypothetical protein Tco_0828986 [Tanacetum coccineum]